MDVESYYKAKEKEYDNSLFDSFPNRKIIALIIIILIIIFLFFLLSVQNDEKLKISFEDEEIAFAGSLTVNGELVETFSSNGRVILDSVNPSEKKRIILDVSNSGNLKLDNPRVVIVNNNGTIIAEVPTEYIIINPDGTISFDIDFSEIEDILDDDFVEGENYDFYFQITFTSDDDSEVVVIEVPYEVIFQEFSGSNCLLINKTSVSNPLRNGVLEVPLKLKIVCDSYQDLKASVNWETDVTGNVEILFSNNKGSLLTPEKSIIYSAPNVGEYEATIFYTPNSSAKGKISKFSLDLSFEDSEEQILFFVPNENLEQCINVELVDSVIENENDNATIIIDSSKCSSQKINIFLCKDDSTCSNGSEGSINLSNSVFSLTPNSPIKTINITRNNIPGLYGVSVHASISGTNKVFVDEKEIFVKPTDELVFPKEFSVSLIGGKDSIRIRNTSLTEDVNIDTSVCTLYRNSFGSDPSQGLPILGAFSNSEEWINDLLYNSEKYSGRGFYQNAFYTTLPFISQVRTTAYYTAVQENAKIKQAYLSGKELVDPATDLVTTSNNALDAVNDLQDELSGVNQNADAQLASQIASLVTSLYSLYSDFLVLKTSVETANTSVQSLPTTCPASAASVALAKSKMTTATTNSTLLYSETLQILNTAKDLYTLYQQIDALANKSESIDAESAVENSETVNEKLEEIEEKMVDVMDYLELALQSAAIDSLESASQGHSNSKDYLELALLEMKDIESLKDDIIEAQLSAMDDLTVLGEDVDERTQLIIEGAKLLLDLIEMTGIAKAKLELIRTSVTVAQAELTTAFTAATANCTAYTACCSGLVSCPACCCTQCCVEAPLISASLGKVNSVLAEINVSYAGLMRAISAINLIYQSYQMYESLTASYYSELLTTQSLFSELIEDLYDFELLVINAISDLELAILAAENLSILEQYSSEASGYVDSFALYNEFGEYNKERLVGLIGSLVNNAFVNGAYDGGVYNTNDNSNSSGQITYSQESFSNKIFFSDNIEEDCDNRVNLVLPAYKINLLESKSPTLSSPEIIAYWSQQDLEVFDVFEEQETSIVFANSGLKKNSYVTIHIPVTINEYSDVEEIDSSFGPFDIPSSDPVEKTYSFQIKVNVAPRTGKPTTTYSDSCEKDLLLGNTGNNALPKILLDWEWDKINFENTNGKYLDAAQFSVMLSKKLSTLNDFLKSVSLTCPTNYAYDILEKIIPSDFNLSIPTTCFMPMTTQFYDDKPSIYYYFWNSFIGEQTNFFGGEPINSMEGILDLIRFDVPLMLDGYGLEFQSDFTSYYSKTFLKASPEFMDNENGMYRYFNNSKRFYFTNETIDFKPLHDFVLPDVGLYEITPIIDFSSIPLISGGALNSFIRVDLRLKEPIDFNYSPFYYTPFDGEIGLKNNNDRRYYGSSLSNNSQLQVAMAEPLLLKNDQTDSLVKINSVSINDFYLLNSFDSKRGKILDYSFIDKPRSIFSPTIATPLLFTIQGYKGFDTAINYSLNRNERKVSVRENNLLLLTGLKKCNDFYGQKLYDYINKTPDFVIGDEYGFGFLNVENDGETSFTSTIYAPVEDFYALEFFPENSIQTTNDNNVNDIIPLEGIKGMLYNDISQNDYINSLKGLFDAVEKEVICISSFGNKEIFYWPEKKLFETKNIDGKSLQQQIIQAEKNCLK
ncbi:MAG: hypothetical protein PHP82_02920 [Candidatus ainarchaeum sp.]|nr:hypothetical protein [Candidatus ainarchaeum sp.]